MAPEFTAPQDGLDQQDGELAAAKRWLLAVPGAPGSPGSRPPSSAATATATSRSAAHATAYAWLEHVERNGVVHTAVRARWTGQCRETDTYRYAHSVPLRDADDALAVIGRLAAPVVPHHPGLPDPHRAGVDG